MMPRSTRRWSAAGRTTALWLVLTITMAAPGRSQGVVSAEELFTQARGAFAAGDYTTAVARYEEILRRDRTNLTAILELSNLYERSGHLEYARGLLIRATRIDPDYPAIAQRRRSVDAKLVATLTAEVDSLLKRGDFDTAIAKLSLHNAIDPGNASVHYKRSMCLFEMGRYEAALSDIDVAIAASPQEPYFLLRDRIAGEIGRAEIKRLVERTRPLAASDHPRHREHARELLAEILELDPEHSWAQSETARLNQEDIPDPASDPLWKSTASSAWERARSAAARTGRYLTELIVLAVALILFRSPLTTAIARRLNRPSLLSGDLSRFSVAEVLTMLNAEPHNGVLEVRGKTIRGRVYFEGGEPRHCEAGKYRGVDALMELIEQVRGGRFRFIRGRGPRERTIDTPLSVLLVEQAHETNGVNVRPGVAKKSRMKELLDSRLEV